MLMLMLKIMMGLLFYSLLILNNQRNKKKIMLMLMLKITVIPPMSLSEGKKNKKAKGTEYEKSYLFFYAIF